MHDYEPIYRVSAELSKLLRSQTPLETILSGLGTGGRAAIPSCEDAGVTFEEKGKIVARTTTGENARVVDAHQYAIGEGPCLELPRASPRC